MLACSLPRRPVRAAPWTASRHDEAEPHGRCRAHRKPVRARSRRHGGRARYHRCRVAATTACALCEATVACATPGHAKSSALPSGIVLGFLRHLPGAPPTAMSPAHDQYFFCYPGTSSPYTRSDTYHRGTGLSPDIKFYSLYKELFDLRARGGGKATMAPLRASGMMLPPAPSGKLSFPLQCFQIGNGPARVLVVGGQHADEWVGVSLAFWVAEWLVDQGTSRVSRALTKEVLDACSFWIVPMANPNGNEYTVTVNREFRKDSPWADAKYRDVPTVPKPSPLPGAAPSVDLNRNFLTKHRDDVINSKVGVFATDPQDPTYVGPSASSSFEATALTQLIDSVGFDAVFDFHSNGCMIVYPTADDSTPISKNTLVAQADRDRYAQATDHVFRSIRSKAGMNPDPANGKTYTWTCNAVPSYYSTTNPDQGRCPGSMLDHAFYQYDALPAAVKPPNRTLCIGLELPPDLNARVGHQPDASILPSIRGTCLGAVLGVCRYLRSPNPSKADFDRFGQIP